MGFWGMNEKELKAEAERLQNFETDLLNRQEDLKSKENVFKEKEKYLNSEKKSFDNEKEILKKSIDNLEKEKGKLEKLRQEIIKKEAEAKNGFIQTLNETFKEIIEKRFSDLDEREKELCAFQSKIEKQLEYLNVQKGEISKRDLDITEREQKADAGFADKATALAVETKRQHDANVEEAKRLNLQAESLAQKENDLVERERQILNDEIKRDEGYAEERLNLDKELFKRRQDFENEIANERSRVIAELESEIKNIRTQKLDSIYKEIEKTQEQLKNERISLEKQKGDLSALESELAGRKQQLDQDEKRIESLEYSYQARYSKKIEHKRSK